MIQITDPRVQQAIVLYKSGKGIRAIRNELRIDEEVLKRFFKQEGILLTRQEAVRRGKSAAVIKDNALDILTPDALYWLGFIYADGSLSSDRPRIGLGLSEVDKSHVEKFAVFFGEGLNVYTVPKKLMKDGYYANPSAHVRFSSTRIHSRLIELGITPGKTYDITPHELLRNSRDFWRGVVDGDGWIFNTKVIGVGICGHENTVKEFLLYLNRSGFMIGTNAMKSKKSKHLWSAEIHHNKAISVLKLLYEGSTLYLDRKYEKYLEIKNQINTQQNDKSNIQ